MSRQRTAIRMGDVVIVPGGARGTVLRAAGSKAIVHVPEAATAGDPTVVEYFKNALVRVKG
jgi:hypothetical protein